MVKTTLCLYKACQEAMPDLKFVGIARKPLATILPENFDLVTWKPKLHRNVWRFILYNVYLNAHSSSPVHFPANGMIPKIYTNHNIVMTLHDVLPMIVPNLIKTSAKLNRYKKRRQNDIDRSNIVFTVSEYSKKDIIKYFKVHSEPIVIYNAPTLVPEKYDPIYDIGRVEDYFLYPGGYDRRKGLAPLIKVFLELHREKKITSKLYLTGVKSDIREEFKKMTAPAVALGIVRELDYVTDQEMISLMRNAKGLIYPSYYEGFGLPPVEAMNVGCPVITTPYSSIPEVCGDGVLYINPDNEKEFADAIVALSDNGSLREELIVKGKRQVERYSWNKSAAIFLDQILRLNSGR